MTYKMCKNKVISLFMALVCGILTCTNLQAAEGNYKVKAVFLFKFFKYISWPDGAGMEKTICVYGQNPFGKSLDYIIKNKLSSAEYKVNYIDDVAEVKGCRLLFIGKSQDKVATVLAAIKQEEGILSVSDINGFARKGGGIEFVDHPNKIGLLLNVSAFTHAGLNASSKLMKIVKTVQ
ncbi:MAG: YfiR family protein [Emcibacter sp.]|nr:YfiR family protein [Emcibacter sp.]